jgi:predicted nuclease of predicted toxin-antitoxin system
LEDAATLDAGLRLGDRIFIDECLSAALVSVAKDRQVGADYGPHVGKGGWQDWNIIRFALENDYIVATNNRRDFLHAYANVDLHNGLVILVPSLGRAGQIKLFSAALEEMIILGDHAINKLIEVLEDGTVHVREWTREDHDADHIDNPMWPRTWSS